MRLLLFVASIVMMLAALFGCQTTQQRLDAMAGQLASLQQDAARAAALQPMLEAQAQTVEAQAATMPAGPVQTQARQEALDLRQASQKLANFIQKVDLATQAFTPPPLPGDDGTAAAEAAGKAAAAFIPAPYGYAATALIALAIGLYRAYRTKKAAAKVINSVEPLIAAALDESPGLRLELDRDQGKDGKALVDYAQALARKAANH